MKILLIIYGFLFRFPRNSGSCENDINIFNTNRLNGVKHRTTIRY